MSDFLTGQPPQKPTVAPAVVQAQVANESTPVPDSISTSTNPLLEPQTVKARLANFPDEVYDLDRITHLVKLMNVLIGDAGAGGLRKQLLMSRMASTLSGSSFYMLDRFYGALFGLRRRIDEQYTVDPTGTATSPQWADAARKDADYRSRISQFGKAIRYGASPVGMELAAEAVLSVPCDVYESYLYADQSYQTYAQIEAGLVTYGAMEAKTYAQLEGLGLPNAVGGVNRVGFVIKPHRIITESERYDVTRVLQRLKPANALVTVDPQGVRAFSEIRLRGLAASSEHWEITRLVTTQQVGSLTQSISTPTTPSVPPPSHAQGDEISYNSGILEMLGYLLGNDGVTVLATSLRERLTWADGHIFEYWPWRASRGWWLTGTGRASADGVLRMNPWAYRAWLNGQSSSPLPALYTDHISIDAVNNTLGQAGGGTKVAQTHDDDFQFWSSPRRLVADGGMEAIEFRFDTPKTINKISFEAAHFPHTIQGQYFSEDTQQWVTCCSDTITDSAPMVFDYNRREYFEGYEHPQHYGSNHWVPISHRLTQALTCQRFRLLLQRTAGRTPITRSAFPQWQTTWRNGVLWHDRANENPEPYSLGVRDFDIGLVIDKPPILMPTVTTQDLFGALVQLGVTTERASGLLANPPQHWRCEPQPVPYAVVNLFADTRDVTGNGQVIDRFYVEPTHLGVHATLYYSNDSNPTGTFPASDDWLPSGVVTFGGTVSNDVGGNLLFSNSDPSYIDINNTAIQYNPASDWWVGIGFQAGLPSVVPGQTILDLGSGTTLTVGNNLLTLATPAGTLTAPATYATGAYVSIIAGYLSAATTELTAGLVLKISIGGGPVTTTTLATSLPMGTQPANIRVGGSQTAGGVVTGMSLSALILKQSTLGVATEANIFFANPSLYCIKGRWREDDTHTTDNAVLRYATSLITPSSPSGFVGGPPNIYGGLTWTPIMRDFILSKGYLYVPPTKAKFWKFEFTNLVAEHYESYVPLTRQVLLFPQGVIDASLSGASDPHALGSRPVGTDTHIGILSGDMQFIRDQKPLVPINSSTPMATEAYLAGDPVLAQQLRSSSWVYGFADFHQGVQAPRFTVAQQHNYATAEVSHTSKVGYMVGLKALKAYRIDFLADDDTDVYVEHFHDALNIASNQWNLNPNDLGSTGLTPPVQAVSRVYKSWHGVRGVQFATQQSDPLQIVPDDDFRSGQLVGYNWDSIDKWHKVGDATLVYSQRNDSVVISRSSAPPSPAYTPPSGANRVVSPLPAPTFKTTTYVPSGQVPATIPSGGIVSGTLGTSAAGRIYAAVRFTAMTSITSPFYLGLTDQNGVVLVEKALSPAMGQQVEDYISYDLGSIIASNLPVRVQLVQRGASADTISLDTLSVFDDSILWEFSVDGGVTFYPALGIRNNAWGVLTFPTPGNQLVWRATAYRNNRDISALKIRPLYDGQLTYRPAGPFRGPNVSTFDQYPSIFDDPEFTYWTKPIPRGWFAAYKNYPVLFPDGAPQTNEFSSFYGRPISETVPTPVDQATRWKQDFRAVAERLDIFSPEADSADHSLGVFYRSVAESVSAPVDSADSVKNPIPPANAVVNRPIHPVGRKTPGTTG